MAPILIGSVTRSLADGGGRCAWASGLGSLEFVHAQEAPFEVSRVLGRAEQNLAMAFPTGSSEQIGITESAPKSEAMSALEL